jgi:hypothetical protein
VWRRGGKETGHFIAKDVHILLFWKEVRLDKGVERGQETRDQMFQRNVYILVPKRARVTV